MILFITGCGNEVKTFDPNDLANELIAEVNFDDELTNLKEIFLSYMIYQK